MSVQDKILSEDELVKMVGSLRKEGKVIVTTNGVFDILHIGHIRHFEDSAKLGGVLIVLINTDESVQENKGPLRPIIPESQRVEVAAALQCVTYVCTFSEKTPENILSLIKPDVHTKGGDYKASDMPETTIVEAGGGRVEVLGHIMSSTEIIARIVQRYG